MSDFTIPTTPSDALTPETEAALLPEGEYRGPLIWADFARRLERERDEARAELAKLKTPAPPTGGSHEEWVRARLDHRTKIGGENENVLPEHYALELARRCEAAERSAQHWEESALRHCERGSEWLQETKDLRAQLAAAQADAVVYKRVGEVANKVSFDLMDERNAAQAEARELREALEEIKECNEDTPVLTYQKMEKVACAALAKKEGKP